MSKRPAKPVTMTGADGSPIACDEVQRPVDPSKVARTSGLFNENAAPERKAAFYRRAVLHYVDVSRDELTFQEDLVRGMRLYAAHSAESALRMLYGSRTVEYFGALALDSKNQIVGHAIIGQGKVADSPVSIPELGRFLFLSGAAGFIAFHNHPSGNLEWSAEDLELTRKLAKAGKLLGVTLVDHLLLTSERYLSMLDGRHSDTLKSPD